jgi:hypothetical protein
MELCIVRIQKERGDLINQSKTFEEPLLPINNMSEGNSYVITIWEKYVLNGRTRCSDELE